MSAMIAEDSAVVRRRLRRRRRTGFGAVSHPRHTDDEPPLAWSLGAVPEGAQNWSAGVACRPGGPVTRVEGSRRPSAAGPIPAVLRQERRDRSAQHPESAAGVLSVAVLSIAVSPTAEMAAGRSVARTAERDRADDFASPSGERATPEGARPRTRHVADPASLPGSRRTTN